MATVFVHLNAQRRDEAEWLLQEDGVDRSAVRHGPLSLLANDAKGARVIVLLPGADVTLTDATVPTRNTQRIAAALPYLLEEKFASDVEELHFAFSKPRADNSVDVAVIAKVTLEDWIQRFQDIGIRPHAMIPDLMAVPYHEDTWSILDSPEGVLMRLSDGSGLHVDRDIAVDTLRLSLASVTDSPPAHIVYYLSEADELTPLDFGDLSPEVDVELNQNYSLYLLAKNCQLDNTINVLQGAYSRKEKIGKLWRPWRATAVIGVICLLLFAALKGFDFIELSQKEDKLTAQIEAVYKRILPQATGKASKERIQSLLKSLNGGKGQSDGFLELLAKVAEDVKKTQQVEITRIAFTNKALNIALTLGDLQSLDDLKNRLSKDKSLDIEIQSASSRNNKVEARLQIKGEQ